MTSKHAAVLFPSDYRRKAGPLARLPPEITLYRDVLFPEKAAWTESSIPNNYLARIKTWRQRETIYRFIRQRRGFRRTRFSGDILMSNFNYSRNSEGELTITSSYGTAAVFRTQNVGVQGADVLDPRSEWHIPRHL